MSNGSYTAADLLVESLEGYGVRHVFGNPGTTELPVVHAITESELEYVLGLHEDIAVGMAGGYASTRRYHYHEDSEINPTGFVNLHTVAGLGHGLGNLYDAYVSGASIVCTAGIHSTDFRHEEPILSGDLPSMAEQFTKWSDEVRHPDALPTMLRRAFRVALTPPTGPVFLSLPLNVMMEETSKQPEPLGHIPRQGTGDPESIERAANLLSEAETPVLVVGDQVARSGNEAVDSLVSMAEATGARVFGEILACEVDFPTDHDQWISYLPVQGEVLSTLLDVDTVVFIGCSTQTPLTRYEGEVISSKTKCIHVNENPWELGKNEPSELSILGDVGSVVEDLTKKVVPKLDEETVRSRLADMEDLKASVEAKLESVFEGNSTDGRPSKIDLVEAMYEVAPGAYIIDEGVTSTFAMRTRWPFEPEQYLSNKGGGLGYGLPASIGGALAEALRPEPREVYGFVGDGSYLYYPHSLYTASRYDVNVTVVISDNRNYRILKDNTLEILGGEEDNYDFTNMNIDPSVDLPSNAQSHGVRGRKVEDPEKITQVLKEELSQSDPSVVDVLVHD